MDGQMASQLNQDIDGMVSLLGNRLLEVYQTEQVDVMVDEFNRAGFKREVLTNDVNALYRFMVIAAYDRRPFTRGTGGYEQIWEISSGVEGVPTLLKRTGLWSIEDLAVLSEETVDARLSSIQLGGHNMDNDGFRTRYCKTLDDCARESEQGLLNRLQKTKSTADVWDVFWRFNKRIHGIGDTIASKLVKYLLRELHIGQAGPGIFPRKIAWNLINEWHNKNAASKFRNISPELVPLTADRLEKLGDAFAIDALFYLQRNRPEELNEFIDEL